ncbi:hypothetical protein [Natrinema pallidum]|uniref:Uncharacterized protein n=1 Tax=Natrinema pallidum TaxID=69527 RepID=A0A4P9TDV7_9EURY|nr:hypothetical protein [Natrinema pallidum]QCW02941.1 hypothetical protein FGF80_06695 [Natrinema pallidum]
MNGNSNENENNEYLNAANSRRGMLKLSGTTLATTIGLSGVGSVGASEDSLNTSFNADDRQAAIRFGQKLYDLDEPMPVWDSLSDAQQKTLADLMTDITVEHQVFREPTVETETITPSHSNRQTKSRGKQSAKVRLERNILSATLFPGHTTRVQASTKIFRQRLTTLREDSSQTSKARVSI